MSHTLNFTASPRYTKQDTYHSPARTTDKDGHLKLPTQGINLGKSPRSSSKKAFKWVHGSSPRSAASGSASKGKTQNQENYLTPEARGRDLCDATNFSRFGEIHNAPEKRALGPDSTEPRKKKHDYFDYSTVKVPAFSLDFVDSEEEDHPTYPEPVKQIRNDFAAFTNNIMNVQIGNSLLPASGSTMRM